MPAGRGAADDLGLGSDLIDIRRIDRVIERFGDRFLDRIFTDVERRKCDRRVKIGRRAMRADSLPGSLREGARHRLPAWRVLARPGCGQLGRRDSRRCS